MFSPKSYNMVPTVCVISLQQLSDRQKSFKAHMLLFGMGRMRDVGWGLRG